jgi:hypothetical protein
MLSRPLPNDQQPPFAARAEEAMIQSIEAPRGPGSEPGQRAGGQRDAADAAQTRGRGRLSGSPEMDPAERLVRRLAADHLRDLRDDGMTLDYVARIYGVSPERMEILYGELLPGPPR